MEKENNIRSISTEKVHQKLAKKDDFVLLDVLTADHFNKAHLPNSMNACVFEVIFIEKVKKIVPDKRKEIILYGAGIKSMDAITATKKLIREGYQNVFIMEGGLKEWISSGLNIIGDDPAFLEKVDKETTWINGTYTIDLEKSLLQWFGRNPNTLHYGTVGLSRGEVTFQDDQIDGIFDIDMRSIKNINLEGDVLQPVLESHLMSDDFFFVKVFPKVTFAITSAKPIREAISSAPNFEIHGDLEIRGVKKSIYFLANASEEPGGEIKIEAHFDIDRTDWGIIYGSTRFFEYLGMHLVFDFISIQLRLVAIKN